MQIKANINTVLKKSMAQASSLKATEKSPVIAGKTFKVLSFREQAETNHTLVKLDYGAGEWYIYTPHWEIDLESPPQAKLDWSNMNSKISKYFTVGEILRYDPKRIPQSESVKNNIIKLCKELDKIREAWGHPIIITSGYRPPRVNASVGGVSNSRHLSGDAADISPLGGREILRFQSWLDERWKGALGYGARKGFVHIDMRNGGGFLTSHQKSVRWNY
jgi:putative chitinase